MNAGSEKILVVDGDECKGPRIVVSLKFKELTRVY
jgi:hypothetical protein